MATALEFQLAHRFDELCRRLNELAKAQRAASAEQLTGQHRSGQERSGQERSPEQSQANAASLAQLWDLPLAYWALPNDRRLPKALLGYPLRRIVQTPFAKLRATPGIGVKKLVTLVELVERALAACSDQRPIAVPSLGEISPSTSPAAVGNGLEFDPGSVSESQWAQWCEAVKQHGLAGEPLGRFARTLQDLPGVLWHTPLSDYADLTLEELRGRKTHGEKRVRAVIEVFAMVQSLLGQQPATHLSVRVEPGFAAPVEAWLLEAAGSETFPSAAEVQRSFIDPLLEQLHLDAGETVARLAAKRSLDTTGEFNVRAAAKRLGLTRARVYQLLAEAAAVLNVRWPEGCTPVHTLREKALRARRSGQGAQLFISAADLFYPRRGEADGRANSPARAQRQGNEADSDDQPMAASPRPPGVARSPRRKDDSRSASRRQAVKPSRRYCSPNGSSSDGSSSDGFSSDGFVSDGFDASIDTSTCCPT